MYTSLEFLNQEKKGKKIVKLHAKLDDKVADCLYSSPWPANSSEEKESYQIATSNQERYSVISIAGHIYIVVNLEKYLLFSTN